MIWDLVLDKNELKDRTKRFALRVMRLVEALPDSKSGWAIGKQLIRSGTSVGANYRAACQGRSRADFISKLCIVIEEVDESAFWLELIVDGDLLDNKLIGPLLNEANELTAIFVSSLNTARQNQKEAK